MQCSGASHAGRPWSRRPCAAVWVRHRIAARRMPGRCVVLVTHANGYKRVLPGVATGIGAGIRSEDTCRRSWPEKWSRGQKRRWGKGQRYAKDVGERRRRERAERGTSPCERPAPPPAVRAARQSACRTVAPRARFTRRALSRGRACRPARWSPRRHGRTLTGGGWLL